MLIIIKNKNINLRINDKNIMILKDLCNLGKLKNQDNNILLLISLEIEEGIVVDYNFYIEELFISVPIKAVISNFSNRKVKEICNYYSIPLIEL